jgi:hypothetical protein
MSLVITWSTTDGGFPIAEPVVHGTGVPQGGVTPGQILYLRHNGLNPITNAGLFLKLYSDTYVGSFTASEDFGELIDWGNAALATDWGGLMLNQNAIAAFPGTSDPTFANKDSLDGTGFNVRTGVGDDVTNPIIIKQESGATVDGEIAAGLTPNVRIKFFIRVPLSEDMLGVRLFDIAMQYTFTS